MGPLARGGARRAVGIVLAWTVAIAVRHLTSLPMTVPLSAVVIALACRNLPETQRRKGIMYGVGGAIGLRVVLTFFAVGLLALPYLKLIGALLLLWIGIKLILPEGEHGEGNIKAEAHLWGAIKTIIIADFVMSLDNVIGVAAAAKGNVGLLVFGLLIAARAQLPTWGGALLCGAFALFHGYAHGTEFPAGAQAMFPYFVGGFAVATALLHTAGIGAGFALKPRLARSGLSNVHPQRVDSERDPTLVEDERARGARPHRRRLVRAGDDLPAARVAAARGGRQHRLLR